jgi:hypothetical protein
MENEKKEMMSRIADLETELANFTSGNQREKVAENVEYIRVWRQLQRQNEKLIVTQSANEILNEQVCQLNSRLEECNKYVCLVIPQSLPQYFRASPYSNALSLETTYRSTRRSRLRRYKSPSWTRASPRSRTRRLNCARRTRGFLT